MDHKPPSGEEKEERWNGSKRAFFLLDQTFASCFREDKDHALPSAISFTARPFASLSPSQNANVFA